MRLGSLFDGSGTAPLAASMCGIDPVWASEIEPYPIRVTKARFPGMKHLGSITEINGADVVPVDIICGGSPCQDLSVAGKQAGLHNGERSHLFFEMTRIIAEMRGATNGKYPRYIVWENVPGAFSSNKGRDFLAVLQSFAEIADPDVHVPEPESKSGRLAWKYAGEIVGDGWSVAWRTVDAQYWGVPQRRRRIYLVADLTGECAGEVLFERTGLSGHPEPSGTQGKETASDAGGSIEGSGGVKCLNPWDSQTIRQYSIDGCFPALSANSGGGQMRNGVVYPVIARTLTAEHDASPCVDRGQNVIVQAASFKAGKGWRENECYTLNTIDRPAVVFDITGTNSNSMKSSTPDSCFRKREVARTLDTFVHTPECNQGGNVVVETCGALCARDYKGVGSQYVEEGKVIVEPVCIGNGQLHQISMAPQSNCLDCMHDQQAVIYPGVGITSKQNASNPRPGDPAPTISTDSRNYLVKDAKPPRKYIIHRLTPLECCRLQGFPDWWTEGCEDYPLTAVYSNALRYVNPYGKIEGSDSAKYKMWGNGMALPNMLHVMRGIARQCEGGDQHENHP